MVFLRLVSLQRSSQQSLSQQCLLLSWPALGDRPETVACLLGRPAGGAGAAGGPHSWSEEERSGSQDGVGFLGKLPGRWAPSERCGREGCQGRCFSGTFPVLQIIPCSHWCCPSFGLGTTQYCPSLTVTPTNLPVTGRGRGAFWGGCLNSLGLAFMMVTFTLWDIFNY